MTTPDVQGVVRDILARLADEPGGLLPILHELQDTLGYVPQEALPQIAAGLNLSRAEVHGVVSYYHHFRTDKPGRQVLQMCRAEACKSMGADALIAHAQQRLGCKLHEQTADGAFSLEPVFCLGLCSSSPALMLGHTLHARMTPAKFDALIEEARS
ncbi:MAG: formate dehydrogenase subunit gamma [Paucibacter sp.]|nr:formate dehydrogenase subunit gamma [Roseateles sp.]